MILKKRKIRRALPPLLTLLAGAALILLVAVGVIRFNDNLQEQQLAAVEQSVESAVIHCYSLEGAYPPNLDYLAENYGLVLDRSNYIYDYTIFASNIPPEIRVLKKN